MVCPTMQVLTQCLLPRRQPLFFNAHKLKVALGDILGASITHPHAVDIAASQRLLHHSTRSL